MTRWRKRFSEAIYSNRSSFPLSHHYFDKIAFRVVFLWFTGKRTRKAWGGRWIDIVLGSGGNWTPMLMFVVVISTILMVISLTLVLTSPTLRISPTLRLRTCPHPRFDTLSFRITTWNPSHINTSQIEKNEITPVHFIITSTSSTFPLSWYHAHAVGQAPNPVLSHIIIPSTYTFIVLIVFRFTFTLKFIIIISYTSSSSSSLSQLTLSSSSFSSFSSLS